MGKTAESVAEQFDIHAKIRISLLNGRRKNQRDAIVNQKVQEIISIAVQSKKKTTVIVMTNFPKIYSTRKLSNWKPAFRFDSKGELLRLGIRPV